MDNFIFLEPLTPSSSQPPRLPGGISSNISRPSLASRSDLQTTSQFNQRNHLLKSQPTQSRDVSDLSKKSHSSDQRCRNDTVQDQDSTAQTSPDSDNDDDVPSIEKLLSGKWQKNSSASAEPNGVDDDGFVDIDDVLSSTQPKSMLASANLNSGGIAVLVDNGSRGGSPADSSCSDVGSSQDPIILSDDEPAGAESETDCSDIDVDVRAKSVSDPPHVAGSELADGGGIGSGSGAVLSPGRFVTDHSDDQNDHDGVFDNPQPRLSAVCPTPASHNSGSATHQASKTQVNTDLIQGSTSHGDFDDVNVAEELEGEGFDVFAEGDEADSHSAKGPTLPATSDKNSSSHNNITGLRDAPPDGTQSPLLALAAAASPHQPDLKNGQLPKQLRRGANRHDRRKRLRTVAPTRAVTTASTASAASESADLEEPKSRIQITAPDEEWEHCDTDQRMADGGSADDSDDEDYADMSDPTGPTRGGRLHSRKRARRTKDQAHNDAGGPASHPLDVSRQAAPVASSSGTQESEEMSIHGYFTLKTVASKVVYCLTFSQDLLPLPQHRGQRQDSNLGCEHSQSSPLDCGTRQAPLPRQTMRRSWTRETTSDTISTRRPGKELTERQEILLAKMVHDDKTWAEIGGQFPGHTLQSLKENFFTKQGGKPRKRGRKPGVRAVGV
ncbi:hypothetical protein DL95DRAFT_470777 [Leptodontidium sp. 2 PMI_412]|nr:hypothetical protein DL95DRAFT_470777 [Leptodontidium sp. 2 PMI_412]